VTKSCILRPKYDGCRVTCRSSFMRKNIVNGVEARDSKGSFDVFYNVENVRSRLQKFTFCEIETRAIGGK
jgi:hypothetical protein